MHIPSFAGFFISILFVLGSLEVNAAIDSFVPSGGEDTSDAMFDVFKVIIDDDEREYYKFDFRNETDFHPDVYQEYTFDITTIPATSEINSVILQFQFLENIVKGAKLDIWDHDSSSWFLQKLDVSVSDYREINEYIDLTSMIDNQSDLINLKIRFFAFGTGKSVVSEIDLVLVTVDYLPPVGLMNKIAIQQGFLFLSSLTIVLKLSRKRFIQ